MYLGNLKERIDETYQLRMSAYQRIKNYRFWLRILEIYYAIITALLAVYSAIDKKGSFSYYLALFSIMVAVIVCFTAGQNYSEKIHNIELELLELDTLKHKVSCPHTERKDMRLYKQYIKRCGGREYYSIVDKYKDDNTRRYKAILVIEVILLIALFLIPRIALICKEYM